VTVTAERRVDAYLVCGGKYHDFDFARLQLLSLLAEDEHIRVQVAQDYGAVDAIGAADFLVTYTCDVRPTESQQQAIRAWVEGGGRWLALHGTNCALDPPSEPGAPYTAPRLFPSWVGTLGSQFLSHPSIEPYVVQRSAGAEHDPLVADIGAFETGPDELYLMEHHGDVVPLLETHWSGTTRGFADADWPGDEPRLVLYRRPLGAGEVVYFTLGHCRSHWDMVDPPFNGARWPTVDRGSWEIPEFVEILRRGIAWAAGGDGSAT
jgi:type 1 glutamine amidotransferase